MNMFYLVFWVAISVCCGVVAIISLRSVAEKESVGSLIYAPRYVRVMHFALVLFFFAYSVFSSFSAAFYLVHGTWPLAS